jgi:chorismate mutase
MHDEQVEAYRRELEEIDASLVALLRLRVRKSTQVAWRKRAIGAAVYDPARERLIAERVEAGPVRDAYRAVVVRCRQAGQAAVRGAVDGRDPRAPADGSAGR